MKAFYKELFEYSHTMNQKLIEIFMTHSGKTTEYSLKLISHLVNAQHIWNCRMQSEVPKHRVWAVNQLDLVRSIDTDNFKTSCRIVDELSFETTITYVNSHGNKYTNPIKDILFHIVNHGTYHRGQIAADFKMAGIDPLVSDYIAFKR